MHIGIQGQRNDTHSIYAAKNIYTSGTNVKFIYTNLLFLAHPDYVKYSVLLSREPRKGTAGPCLNSSNIHLRASDGDRHGTAALVTFCNKDLVVMRP